MITAHLLRAIVIGGLVGLAASLIELALAGGGRPRRFVWLAALMLATVLPAAGMIGFDRAGTSSGQAGLASAVSDGERPVSSGPRAAGGAPRAGAGPRTSSAPGPESPGRWTMTVPAWLGAFDRPLAALWLIASLLWVTILIGSAIRIHRNRMRWRETMLDGMPVYTSHDIGPALFGLTRFGIVVPAWVDGLEPERRRLIVAHEREHARAADPVTLLAGALFVLVQPLNPAVWLMFRRLRLAIEIDCDARVLASDADVRMYGELLIDVGERTLTGAAPLAALSEGGSQLERRIAAMAQPTAPMASSRVIGALVASAVMLLVAWNLPLLAATGVGQAPGIAATDSSAPPAAPPRAIVRVRDVGLHNTGPRPTILIWSEGGPVQFATGIDSLQPLVDTVRLDHLPAMRFDVTDGNAVVALEGPGMLLLGAEVTGGSAKEFTAAGPKIIFLRGGTGVAGGDSIAPYVVDFGTRLLPNMTDDVLWRLVEERYPAMVDGPLGTEPYLWLLIDGEDRLIGSNRGLGDLPRDAAGRLGNLRSSRVRRMLPGMASRLRKGESWGWRQLERSSGDTLHVIWVRQLYDKASTGPT